MPFLVASGKVDLKKVMEIIKATTGERATMTPKCSVCILIFPCFFLLRFFCLFIFKDRVSLYNPGCPGTHSVD